MLKRRMIFRICSTGDSQISQNEGQQTSRNTKNLNDTGRPSSQRISACWRPTFGTREASGSRDGCVVKDKLLRKRADVRRSESCSYYWEENIPDWTTRFPLVNIKTFVNKITWRVFSNWMKWKYQGFLFQKDVTENERRNSLRNQIWRWVFIKRLNVCAVFATLRSVFWRNKHFQGM